MGRMLEGARIRSETFAVGEGELGGEWSKRSKRGRRGQPRSPLIHIAHGVGETHQRKRR
jgi:hypothetical protein